MEFHGLPPDSAAPDATKARETLRSLYRAADYLIDSAAGAPLSDAERHAVLLIVISLRREAMRAGQGIRAGIPTRSCP